MWKRVPMLALLMALVPIAGSQVIHTTAALDVDNVFTGLNVFNRSLTLTESACLSGVAGSVILCDDPTSHRLKFNSNGTGAVLAVGILTPGTAGHCTQLDSNGIDLVDSGAVCGGGGGGGNVNGSGTPGTFPIWTAPTVLGDSNLVAVTGPNGVRYTTGSGQTIRMDASNLLWNTGVAGSGSIIIQNIYAPGGNNNAGGIKIIGAPATGSACAGGVAVVGAGTNGLTNGGNITVNGGCSNGFGATGADITITGGNTAANNGGGSVRLIAGTGGFANGAVSVTGRFNLTASTTASSGLNTGVGSAPTSPINGDLWSTTVGVFARVNGATVQLSGASAPVTSVFTRTGAVVAASGDYTAAQVTNAVSTAAANTGAAAMTLNMAASTSAAAFRVPNLAGASSTTLGAISYDTTNKNFHAGANAVDNIVALLPSSISPNNNDCVKFSVVAGVTTLNTAGVACGASGITGSGLATFIPVFSGSTAITNSMLVDDGTTLTYTGTGGIAVSSSTAGYVGLGQGTAQATSVSQVGLTAPTSVTGYNLVFPGAAGNGYIKWTNASNIDTGAFHTVIDALGTNLDRTAQSASLGSQTLVTSAPVAGRYTIDYYLSESAGCATPGPGVVTATFSWTDATVARTLVSSTLTFTTSPGAGDTVRGSIPLWAASGSAITAIATYTACTTGTATYDLHAWVTEAQ